eukprot:530450_1
MIFFACVAALFALGAAHSAPGPKFSVEIKDPSSLGSSGVGALNLKGSYQRELLDSVTAGVEYSYNEDRSKPSSVWIATSADLDDDAKFRAKAQYHIASKTALLGAELEKDGESVGIDFDTSTNEPGPLRLTKIIDFSGRSVRVSPEIDLKARTGRLVVNADIDDEKKTVAELIVDHQDESASLEVGHQLDDQNRISPKINLKNGDIAVRLDRNIEDGGALTVTATKDNVDFAIKRNHWVTKGNVPINNTGKSSISFKHSIEL